MSLLLEILVFLVAALIVVPICRRFGLSAVLGYLLAGLLIGPSALGLFDEPDEVLHFAEIGVVLLLFIIGLELQPKRLWIMRRLVFGLGASQIFVTAIAIAFVCVWALGLAWPAGGLIGFALALSSTAFVLQLLGEQKKLNRPHGRAAFGTLLMQDVAVIPAIALINVVAGASAEQNGLNPVALAVVVAGLVAARFTLRPALRSVAATGIHELFTAAALALVVGAALAMYSVGLSMGLGAFVAGMMVADSEYRHQLEADVTPFKGLLLGLFFMAVGMSANLALLGQMPLTILGLTLALMVVKAAIVYPLALAFGLERPSALRAGIVLSQGGEFAFVLLTAGVASRFLDQATADVVVLVITLSMALTPLFVAVGDRIGARRPERAFDKIEEPENPVVIAGFGRFGQIVGRVLSARRIPFTVLEANPDQVDVVRRYGNKVYFGDASRLDVLRAAQIDKARVIVIAVDDAEFALRIAGQVRESSPKVAILARARDRQHELRLREFGVDFVVREMLVSSLELTEELLVRLGSPRTEAEAVVAAFRAHDAKTLSEQLAVFHDEKEFRQSVLDAAAELKELFREDAKAHLLDGRD
jgi:glutathione-regulated potassium-efflux system ancillary protein KefC/glutathione-regulated potassium-efflux system protein KefB